MFADPENTENHSRATPHTKRAGAIQVSFGSMLSSNQFSALEGADVKINPEGWLFGSPVNPESEQCLTTAIPNLPLVRIPNLR